MHDAERLYLGQDDAGQHVTQSEEDGVAEAISPQQMLVQQQDTNIGCKPAPNTDSHHMKVCSELQELCIPRLT